MLTRWFRIVAVSRASNGPQARCTAYELSPAFNLSR